MTHPREIMNRRSPSSSASNVTIRVSGKLFQGHLDYLDQLVRSARSCGLWPLLSLAKLEEIDRAALFYLIDGEKNSFGIISCPDFILEWMEHERHRAAA